MDERIGKKLVTFRLSARGRAQLRARSEKEGVSMAEMLERLIEDRGAGAARIPTLFEVLEREPDVKDRYEADAEFRGIVQRVWGYVRK